MKLALGILASAFIAFTFLIITKGHDFITIGGHELRGIYFVNEEVGWVKKKHSHIPMSKSMPEFTYLETRDGGETWREISDGWILRRFRDGMHFINENEGWSVEGGFDDLGVVFHTVDGGRHWEKHRIKGEGFRAIQFVNEKVGWVVGTAIYKTIDGGKTWEKKAIGKGVDLMGISFLNERIGWICGAYYGGGQEDGIVLHTVDGGESWTINYLDQDLCPIVDIYFQNETTGWILAYFGDRLLKTTDGGKSWEMIYDFGSKYCISSLYFVNENVGWAVGDCDPAILKTTDGGKSWTRQY